MTLSVFWARTYLVLWWFLIFQVMQRIEGYPRSLTKASQDTRNLSMQEISISKLIEAAYDRQELLRPELWRQSNSDHLVTRSLDQDTWRQSEYLNEGISMSGERRLLEATSTSTHRTNADEIIFPDGRISTIPTSTSSSTCYKNMFCENVSDYPRQLVNAAIARNASLRFLENVDSMSDIEQRIDTTDEVPLCRYRNKIVYPQTAPNKENQWFFIVNQDNLKQGIRIEVCLNEGQECNMIQGFAEGYKTICKQKFIYRDLAVIGNNGNIFKEPFPFPSSCCCHVKFTGDPTVRVRLGLDLRFFNQTTTIAPKRKR